MVTFSVNNKTIKNIELAVFDKDGTIIDLYNYWCHMIELRAENLCCYCAISCDDHKINLMYSMGVDVKNNRLRPDGPVGLLPRSDVRLAAQNYLRPIKKISDTKAEEIFKEADRLSLNLLDKFIKPIPGAIELLKNLKQQNCKIAIATTDKTERAELAASFLKIDNLFDMIVGADKVALSKPAPDMLRMICRNLSCDPANAVMVGDAKTDVLMGINSCCKASIAVCTGLTPKDELSALTPYIADNIAEIFLL
ncbi:HAD family hydrolase [bacterium]|nr:HAD family hydrolase [bacterium]